MAYNQYTPATTAYVEAAFKEYDTYVDTDVKGIRERLSSDEESIKTNTANIATNVSNIATNASNIANLQTKMETVSYTNAVDEDGILTAYPGKQEQVLMVDPSLKKQTTLVFLTPKQNIVALGGGEGDPDYFGIEGVLEIIDGGDFTLSCQQNKKQQEEDAKAQIDELLGIETEEDDE